MVLLTWIIQNFGMFFGPVFLLLLFLMVRRLIMILDYLRRVSVKEDWTMDDKSGGSCIRFLDPYFELLTHAVNSGKGNSEAIIDAIWSEADSRISIHFQAIAGYVNTIILIGFAGTIGGAIGAFNEMFIGLGNGEPAVKVFTASWNNGLATALYTSLGAAAIGGVFLSIISSRALTVRAKRFEILVHLAINDIYKGEAPCNEGDKWESQPIPTSRTSEKTSLLTSSL